MQLRRLALATVIALAATACSIGEVLQLNGAHEAVWALAPDAQLEDGATEIPLLVQEVECASARDPRGSIEAEVRYGDDEVGIRVLIREPEGDAQTCPGNPVVPYTLELTEPLDGRRLVNDAESELAQRPIEGEAIGQDGVGQEDPDSTSPGGLIVDGRPTESEVFLAEALLVRARERGDLSDVSDLSPHPDGVKLYLGDRLMKEPTADDLTEDETWVLDVGEDGFEGFAGPFHVLDILARAEAPSVAVGPQPHCAGPPRPAPTGMDDATRIALRPTMIDSCIDWFVINLFVDEQDRLRAVQLDLFGP